MKSPVTIITIGVDDLDRSLRFYRDGPGFQLEESSALL
jgi:catechol 2,3-dioxygenase-like lactoylglutathione lyase family enzyme